MLVTGNPGRIIECLLWTLDTTNRILHHNVWKKAKKVEFWTSLLCYYKFWIRSFIFQMLEKERSWCFLFMFVFVLFFCTWLTILVSSMVAMISCSDLNASAGSCYVTRISGRIIWCLFWTFDIKLIQCLKHQIHVCIDLLPFFKCKNN